MGPERPHKEPKAFHRAPRLGPTDLYGDEQLSFFLLFCEILSCFILMFFFLHNFCNYNSKSNILVIFQQRTKWAERKHMVFLTRVLRKVRNHQKTKWKLFCWTPCMNTVLWVPEDFDVNAKQMQEECEPKEVPKP